MATGDSGAPGGAEGVDPGAVGDMPVPTPAAEPGVAPAGAQAATGKRSKTPANPGYADPQQRTPKTPGIAPSSVPSVTNQSKSQNMVLDRHGITHEEVAGLKRLFKSFDPADIDGFTTWTRWVDTTPASVALNVQDRETLWNSMESYLVEQDYPAEVILALEDAITRPTNQAAPAPQKQAMATQAGPTSIPGNAFARSTFPENKALTERLRAVYDRIPESTSPTVWSGTLLTRYPTR